MTSECVCTMHTSREGLKMTSEGVCVGVGGVCVCVCVCVCVQCTPAEKG